MSKSTCNYNATCQGLSQRAAVGVKEVPNPVCTIREGFLKEVILRMVRVIGASLRGGQEGSTLV